MTNAFVSVLGIALYYTAMGNGSPIVYIHGNLGSSTWFSRIMDVPGHSVYALDLPNFGRSDAMPGEVDLDTYADHVKGFIDALGMESPIIVAHSLGGAVAQSLAIRYPESVRALVLIDSAAPNGLVTPRERHPFIEMMRKDKAMLSKALATVVPNLKDMVFFNALVDDAAIMAEKAWIGNAEALSRFDVTARTKRFTKPVLVIWGAGDYLVTREMAEATAKAYPGANLRVLEGVGHSVIAEDPKLFSAILKEFIDSL